MATPIQPARAVYPTEERKGQPPTATGGAETVFGKGTKQLDDWLAIGPDGAITVYSGKVELGTGVRTALAQIVAEELDVPLERIQMVMGDTALSPDEGYTAGSMTVRLGGLALRQAAAEARRTLLEMASDRLDAALDELTVDDGVVRVTHHPDRTITYTELMGGQKFGREVTGNAPLKNPADYRVVGQPAPRLDLPRKAAGGPSFIQDVRVPGMLHARVVPPPGPGAQLRAVDESSVAGLAGLVKIVRLGNLLGVIAEREEQAVRAAQQLKVDWQETDSLPRQADLFAVLRDQPTKDEVLVEAGDVESALSGAARQLQATYRQPYNAHASLGPSCAVADVREDQITIWASTQGPYPLRGALAQLLEVPPEKVRLIHVEGAGCYGQTGADDVAAEAAILSRAVGRPVRVQWSREQEFAWEPKAAAMLIELRAGLDARGGVVAWENDVWSPTHTARPRMAGLLLAAQWMAGQAPPPTRFFLGGERNAATNYVFPNQRVRAALAGQFTSARLFLPHPGRHRQHIRQRIVCRRVSGRSRLGPPRLSTTAHHRPACEQGANLGRRWLDGGAARPPQTTPAGPAVGFGIAFAQYEGSGAYVATVAEVEVDRESGALRVRRITVAHDCGLVINPDGVRNQIEGNVIQSLSRALKEEVTFDRSRVTSLDWQSYPILTFSEIPEIDVVLINRPDQPALGAGEPAMVTTAAAVGNAIFAATGARLRQVPFTPERIKAALIR